MKRQLPLINIDGTTFLVDVINDCLRQQSDMENRIPFEVFEQRGDGYSFLYDRRLKSAATDQEVPGDHKRYKKITLPALMELDPEGIALKYHIPLAILCPEKMMDKMMEDEEDEVYNEEFE